MNTEGTTMNYKRTPEQRQKIDELIWALLSGKYKRATGNLRWKDEWEDGMCCLGVACDINQEAVGIKWSAIRSGAIEATDQADLLDYQGIPRDNASGYAPKVVADLYGLGVDDQVNLGMANDGCRADAVLALDVSSDDPWSPGGAVIKLLQKLRDE